LTDGTVFGAFAGMFAEPVAEVAAAGGAMLAAGGAKLGAGAALLSGVAAVLGAALTVCVAPTAGPAVAAGAVEGVGVAKGTAGPGEGGLTVGTALDAVKAVTGAVGVGVVAAVDDVAVVEAVGLDFVCDVGAGVVVLAGCVAATAGVLGSGGFAASDFVGSAKRRSTKYSDFVESPFSELKSDESA
jgi:hypothetical protein